MGEQRHPCMIDYTNFKNSIEDSELHALYAKFWSDHHAPQHRHNQERVVTAGDYFEAAGGNPRNVSKKAMWYGIKRSPLGIGYNRSFA